VAGSAEDVLPGEALATLRDARTCVYRALVAAGMATAALEARMLVAAAAGVDPLAIIRDPRQPLTAAAKRRLQAWLQRRLAHEPLAYLLGQKEFWSLTFGVSRATLIPRPDSETLVETALRRVASRGAPLRIADLGTGSGCLLLALLSELPAAYGVGVDLASDALGVAQANAAALGLADRASFVQGDWGAALRGGFDLVLANPPYVAASDWPALAPDIRNYEPRLALAGGDDGLAAYRQIVPALPRLLSPDGQALLELGDGHAAPVIAIARRVGMQPIELSPDLAGVDRCLVLARDPLAAQYRICLESKQFPSSLARAEEIPPV
jgi:release factor glutamine methyltransferase